MFTLQPIISLKKIEAILIALILVLGMGYTIIELEWVPHSTIILAIITLLVFGFSKKISFREMQDRMAQSVFVGMGAIYLFFFIGILVSALMMSGAIPTLMYYGLNLISAKYFYLSAFILTSIIGISIGSSLTTCATLGVAFIGMSKGFGADLAITAGAIVSGAFFGDKMSPLSDTTGIAASIVGIDLFEHIKNMMYTTIPAFVITAALFLWIAGGSTQAQLSNVSVFQEQLLNTGLIHWYALLPFVFLIILVFKKINAIVAIIATIFFSLLLTYIHSSPSLASLGGYFFSGYHLEGPFDKISSLISRGGIASMFFTQTIVILALSLGGLLFALGVIPALLSAIQHVLTSASRATACVAATSVGVNLLIGEQYLSILLAGETFKPIYDRLYLHRRNLSRTLEDAGTVINPLVPWSVCGVFISHVLGVSVLAYAPYAFFCYLSLLLTLVFGLSGLTITKQDEAIKD